MKKYTLIILMAMSSVAALAQNKWNTEPYLTKSLSQAAIKEAFVRTSGGSISVSGVEASQARIEVYVSPNNNDKNITTEELKQRLDDNYTLEITDKDHELHATAKSKFGNIDWRKSVSISFKIFVPVQVATNLTTSGGSIRLANLAGDQNFATSGGSLHIASVSGKIKGRTSGGSIQVEDAKQEIDLTTSGGSIAANNCDGIITLVTSGGSLKLNQLNGTINATTSGGSVIGSGVKGELITSTSGGSINLTEMACSIEASTSAGSVRVQMSEVGKYVKLNTSAGSIDLKMPPKNGLDLNLKGDRVNASISGKFQGSTETDRIEGKLNGGGTLVQAHASNGRVTLRFE
ncbi:DUF4097 family beta strand repeat-containing protein [Mucilaginibacter sp. PAMB04168]|uniref:DUF4097 family beta strand repeat-containing protein n=1 Tax=Mucilaginibacter sp. PAMB04168 TaxID=3138567 RepID=UPI0031F6A662